MARMFCGRWDWKSFRDLPTETFTVDIHCVTRWSKLGTSWEGVSLDTLLAELKTDASHAMARSYGDYTTNLPLNDLRNGQAWIAFRFDGKDLAPNTADLHGFLFLTFIYGRAPNGCGA